MPRRPTPAQADRSRQIFARVMDGQSTGAIAAAEGVTVRRVQQIVAAELARVQSNPAHDLKFLQIARLETAFELLGGEIDAGKPAAVPAFLKVAEQLAKLTGELLNLSGPGLRSPGDAARVRERMFRLDAAREVVAERRRKTAESVAAKPNQG